MPLQNHAKYGQQNPDIRSRCISSTEEAELDLERKIALALFLKEDKYDLTEVPIPPNLYNPLLEPT